MAISQLRSKRKSSGGRYKAIKGKKFYNTGNLPSFTKVDKLRSKKLRVKGGNEKILLLSVDVANVYNKKEKKYVKSKILGVVENPANRNFVRRGILNKGAVIKTEAGNARITSRPGQEGTVNAVLV